MSYAITFSATRSARKLALGVLVTCSIALETQGQTVQGHDSAPGKGTGAVLAQANATLAERPPVIDGRDDDAIWRAAAPITGFRVFDPKEDGDPSAQTEVRIAYDAQNLYVFARMFDQHPDNILSLLSRRDVKTQSDQIKIMIDSYHDRRTGYEFAVRQSFGERIDATRFVSRSSRLDMLAEPRDQAARRLDLGLDADVADG